ncbi:kinesin-like protein klp-3 isoform X1 [Mytilus trossulus]|uniref:kinesin-like protein klp-3 isoform X1 n=1 Tax=Mytilus trossulus TaxID=6551 RepID=UPI00300558A1
MGSGASTEDGSSRPSTVQKVNVKPVTNNNNKKTTMNSKTTPAATPRANASTPRKKEFQEVEMKSNNKPKETTKPSNNTSSRPNQQQSSRKPEESSAAAASGGGGSRGKGTQQQQNRSEVDESQEDIVFETFYHRSGREFQCMYLNGMRFYLDDWGSKEWQPFPKRWYQEGLLITNTVVKDAENDQRNREAAGAAGSGGGTSGGGQGGPKPRENQSRGSGGDDREGHITHPRKKKIPTYIFQRKHNIHCFYDHDNGQWMRMPIGYELHHEMVSKLVDQVEEALPHWNDRHDILAMLRQCNYDADECINTYLHLEGDEWLKAPKTSKEAKDMNNKEERLNELEQTVKQLRAKLDQESRAKNEAERIVKQQEDKITSLEVESKQAEAQLAVLQERPKTAMRPKTPQVVTKVVKEETVNPDDVKQLNTSVIQLRKAHVHLKMEVQRYFDGLKGSIGECVGGMKKMKNSGAAQSEEMEEVRALYRKEALQRKILYNQLQEMRGNIRVFCRARKDDRAENCLKFLNDQDLVVNTPQSGKKMFSFDKAFDPNTSQEQVFEDTKGIITCCADGYNVCLMAYGQTGSGKTFTMMGPDSNPGINIRAINELFKVCKEKKDTVTYVLKVSLIEIYNETIQDLLTKEAKTLDLKTAGNKINIPGLTEVDIKTLDDIKKVMAMGDKNRTTASTKMNSTSSRSHLLLLLSVEGTDKITGAISKGTLTLCDLAGSERISKTEAEGQRLVEAAAINKSLSALGQVFTSLRQSQLHIPYRNSKLTQILQPSLGGDAKACLFVNISPDSYNCSETVSTLTFGSNAKQVALGQAKQNIKKGN